MTNYAAKHRVAIERTEGWAGECRVNLMRLLAILALYGQHLANFYWFQDGDIDDAFHVRVTMLVLSWSVVVAAVYFALRRGWAHPSLKFLTTVWDAVMVSGLVMLSGQPRGVFVMLYLLVIASAVLRLSLPLVYVATASAAMGYLASLAHYAWVTIGSEKYYAEAGTRIPRSEQFMVLLVFLIAGLLAGQAVRQARRVALSCIAKENDS